MRAWKSELWVNLWAEQTSPAAKMRGLVVRRRSSTRTPARASYATPARSRSRPSTFGARPTADQDLVHASALGRARPRQVDHASRRRPPCDAVGSGRPAHEPHAVAAERRLDARARRRGPRGAGSAPSPSTSVTPSPEAGEGLGQLAADGPGADHRQAARQLGEARTRSRWSGSRPRRGRGSAGAAARAPVAMTARRKRERGAVHLDGVRAGEAARRRGTRRRRGRRSAAPSRSRLRRGAQPAHALHDGGKVDARARRHVHAELARVPHLGGGARGADQGLRRHAADVEAVAAHQVALDQRDAGAEPGRAGRGHQARPCRRRSPPGCSGRPASGSPSRAGGRCRPAPGCARPRARARRVGAGVDARRRSALAARPPRGRSRPAITSRSARQRARGRAAVT